MHGDYPEKNWNPDPLKNTKILAIASQLSKQSLFFKFGRPGVSGTPAQYTRRYIMMILMSADSLQNHYHGQFRLGLRLEQCHEGPQSNSGPSFAQSIESTYKCADGKPNLTNEQNTTRWPCRNMHGVMEYSNISEIFEAGMRSWGLLAVQARSGDRLNVSHLSGTSVGTTRARE